MSDEIKINLKTVCLRPVFLYLTLAVIFILLLGDSKAVFGRTKLSVLNRIRPASMQDLVVPFRERKEYTYEQIEPYYYYYKKAGQIVRIRPESYGLQGFTAYHLGLLDESISSYKKAINRNPTFFWYYYNLGWLYMQKKDYDRAFEVLTIAMVKDKKLASGFILTSLRFYVPIVQFQNREYERDVVLELQSGYARTHFLLVKCLIEKKDYRGALQLLQKLDNPTHPYHADFVYYAAAAALGLKDLNHAAQLFNQAVKLNPRHIEALLALSDLMTIMNKKDLAAKFKGNAEELQRVFGRAQLSMDQTFLELF